MSRKYSFNLVDQHFYQQVRRKPEGIKNWKERNIMYKLNVHIKRNRNPDKPNPDKPLQIVGTIGASVTIVDTSWSYFEVVVMKSSKEKFSKVLPYTLTDLSSMFHFTKKVSHKETAEVTGLTIEAGEKCLNYPQKFDRNLESRNSYLYMSTIVLAMYIRGNDVDLNWNPGEYQICTASGLSSIRQQDYSPGTYLFNFGQLTKCCKCLTHESQRFRTKTTIVCHSPYWPINLMFEGTFVVALVVTLIFPLAIGFLSSSSEASSASRKRYVELIPSRNVVITVNFYSER